MTKEEREKISEILLERMLKAANSYAPIADETEFTERCKDFIASKTDEYLLTRLLTGNPYVLSADK
jgi:hypothetical protein